MACFRSTTLLVLIVALFIAIGTTGTNARKLVQAAVSAPGLNIGAGIGIGTLFEALQGLGGGGGGGGSP